MVFVPHGIKIFETGVDGIYTESFLCIKDVVNMSPSMMNLISKRAHFLKKRVQSVRMFLPKTVVGRICLRCPAWNELGLDYWIHQEQFWKKIQETGVSFAVCP